MKYLVLALVILIVYPSAGGYDCSYITKDQVVYPIPSSPMTAQNYLDRASYVEDLKINNLVSLSPIQLDSANYKIDLQFDTR